MAGRWRSMLDAWKSRKPTPTAKIASDIKASTVKAFQPAVRAGARFGAAHPEAAERISRTGVATQVRTSVQIRKDISKSKHNVTVAQNKVNVLGSRIESAPIRNGVFVGTDSQFNQYQKDVRNYNTNINRFNSENTKIETLEGEKLYPTLERMVSTKIPTLGDVSKKGAAFRRKHPTVAAGIYKTFEKAHARTERVGSDSQRSALAGYTYGSYSSLQQKPVKTVASFAVGGVSVKAVKMIGAVGKAYGAGKKAKRMAQAAQLGILGYYGVKSTEHIMAAPNAYEAGKRAADIMYTEILPMSAGVGAATVGTKVAKVAKTTTKKLVDMPVREFNAQMRAIQIIRDVGMVGTPKLKGKLKPAQKTKPKAPSEKLVVKKVLQPHEQKKLNELISQAEAQKGRPLLESEVVSIKQSLVEPSMPKTPAEVMAEMKVELMQKQINDIVNFRNQHLRIFEPGKVELTYKQMLKAVSTGEKPKLYTPTLKQELRTLSQIRKAELDLKTALKQNAITQPEYKRMHRLISNQKTVVMNKAKPITKTKPIQKVKTLTAQQFTQRLATATVVALMFKQAQKQTQALTPLVAVKQQPITKQKPKQKQKVVPLVAQTPKTITDTAVAIAHVEKVAEKTKPTTTRVPRTKTPYTPRRSAIKLVFPIIPPGGSPFKLKSKKKPIQKDKQIPTYTPYQFKNRVASISSLFG